MNSGPDRLVDALPSTADPRAAALLAKWTSMCADGRPPDREALDVFALKQWLGHISIYEAIDGGADFRIRLEGTRISRMTGEDWTGRMASQIDARFGTAFLPTLREVVQNAEPRLHTTKIYQREFRSAVRMLLPVRSAPDRPVDQIFMVLYLDPGQAAPS